MRQLTDSERKALYETFNHLYDDGGLLNNRQIVEYAFSAGLDHNAAQLTALTAERDRLREQLFKATKDLKRMARDWRASADGDYCQTYNPEMGRGYRRAAGNLEDYIIDTIRLAQEKQNERPS